jgi:hypothetical protein
MTTQKNKRGHINMRVDIPKDILAVVLYNKKSKMVKGILKYEI